MVGASLPLPDPHEQASALTAEHAIDESAADGLVLRFVDRDEVLDLIWVGYVAGYWQAGVILTCDMAGRFL